MVSKSARSPRAGKPKTATPASNMDSDRLESDTNLAVFNASIGEVTPRTAVYVQLGRSLAQHIDNDTTARCPMCLRSGSSPLWAEYRRLLSDLAGVMAEEGADDDTAGVVLRLAGSLPA